jgi:hypothetical protein
MDHLDEYCRARPVAKFAEAVSIVLYGATRGSPSHSVEVTTYGAVDKACRAYLSAREQYDIGNRPELTEFLDWLGGYLSGVNAISLDTSSILGDAPLARAVQWLNTYCSAHPLATFGAAVEALVASNRNTRTTVGIARSSSAK